MTAGRIHVLHTVQFVLQKDQSSKQPTGPGWWQVYFLQLLPAACNRELQCVQGCAEASNACMSLPESLGDPCI